MKKKHLLIAGGVLFVLVALSSCDRDGPAPVIVDHPAAPAIVDSAPPAAVAAAPVAVMPSAPVVVHDHDNGGFFSGLLMGHLMSGGGYGHSSNINTIHHTTVIKNYHPAPRRVATPPATKRYYGSSSFARRSTVTSRPMRYTRPSFTRTYTSKSYSSRSYGRRR